MSAASPVVEAARRLGPADALVAGVLELAAASPLALDALLSVSAVEWSADILSACVECSDRPRLLLNPVFVERFCGTRERLATLLLHELSHISLGHTRLFPRPTALHNLAFDAVVNASLLGRLHCRGVEVSEYAALMEATYAPDEVPFFLLRPPPRWPRHPHWNASEGCPEPLRELHRRLYGGPRKRPGALDQVTYAEILAALVAAVGHAAGEGLLGRLLGAHGVTPLERSAQSAGRDARAADLLPTVVGALGAEGVPGAGAGGERYLRAIERRERERALEHALSRLLAGVFVDGPTGTTRWLPELRPGVSPDPSHDRRAAARRSAARRLGAPEPLLFDTQVLRYRPERRAALVYLDVSASMEGLLERLHAALVPLRRQLAPEVLAFSTEVVPVARRAFLQGRLPSTGGTSIEPVLEHLSDSARRRSAAGRTPRLRALLLSDGVFVDPSARAVEALRASGAELHLGVLGPGPLHESASWVARVTRLPDPISSSTRSSR